MRDQMREKLNTEITRKQFLQFMAAALLAVFGLNNLLSLLTGNRDVQHVLVPGGAGSDHSGFGNRKFGV
jgi:hypothetical protein